MIITRVARVRVLLLLVVVVVLYLTCVKLGMTVSKKRKVDSIQKKTLAACCLL